jgi:hypothetical protein
VRTLLFLGKVNSAMSLSRYDFVRCPNQAAPPKQLQFSSRD